MIVSQHMSDDPKVTQTLVDLAPHIQQLEALRINFMSISASYRSRVKSTLSGYSRGRQRFSYMSNPDVWSGLISNIAECQHTRIERSKVLVEMDAAKGAIKEMIGDRENIIDLTNAWPGYNAVVLASDEEQMISFTVQNVTVNIMVGEDLRAVMEVHDSSVCKPMKDAGYTQIAMHIFEFEASQNPFSQNLDVVEFGALVINNLNEIQAEEEESE